MRATRLSPFVFTCILIFASALVAQTTFNVPSAGFPTIQSAINAAVTGDTIFVAAGTYPENLLWGNQDISLIGAGVGQTLVDGGQVNPCILLEKPSTTASLIEGFTFTNGMGAPVHNGMFFVPSGGGVHVRYAIGGYAGATFRNCEITACLGDQVSAVHIERAGTLRFENVHVHGNNLSSTGGLPGGTIYVKNWVTNVTFENCLIDGNTSAGTTISAGTTCDFTMLDCVVEGNFVGYTVLGLSDPLTFTMARCVFRDNVWTGAIQGAGVITASMGGPNGMPAQITDCLIEGNTVGSTIASISASNTLSDIRNLTIADNICTATGGAVFYSYSFKIENSISWGNYDPTGMPLTFYRPGNLGPVPDTLTAQNCLVEGGLTGAPNSLSSNPLFKDPANGDYRLSPDSPAINTAAVLSIVSSDKDLTGNPRIVGGAVDIGAHESTDLAALPCASGRVGENQGGPFDILLINGSNGGTYRTLSVPIGTSSTMSVLQPPNIAPPVDFSVFGLAGEAGYQTVWNVPVGIGDMTFAPAPAAPFLQPLLFTYASSVAPINGVAPWIPASATPWSSGYGPAIPFPLTVSFQGVIAEPGNLFTPTNVIVLKVE